MRRTVISDDDVSSDEGGGGFDGLMGEYTKSMKAQAATEVVQEQIISKKPAKARTTTRIHHWTQWAGFADQVTDSDQDTDEEELEYRRKAEEKVAFAHRKLQEEQESRRAEQMRIEEERLGKQRAEEEKHAKEKKLQEIKDAEAARLAQRQLEQVEEDKKKAEVKSNALAAAWMSTASQEKEIDKSQTVGAQFMLKRGTTQIIGDSDYSSSQESSEEAVEAGAVEGLEMNVNKGKDFWESEAQQAAETKKEEEIKKLKQEIFAEEQQSQIKIAKLAQLVELQEKVEALEEEKEKNDIEEKVWKETDGKDETEIFAEIEEVQRLIKEKQVQNALLEEQLREPRAKLTEVDAEIEALKSKDASEFPDYGPLKARHDELTDEKEEAEGEIEESGPYIEMLKEELQSHEEAEAKFNEVLKEKEESNLPFLKQAFMTERKLKTLDNKMAKLDAMESEQMQVMRQEIEGLEKDKAQLEEERVTLDKETLELQEKYVEVMEKLEPQHKLLENYMKYCMECDILTQMAQIEVHEHFVKTYVAAKVDQLELDAIEVLKEMPPPKPQSNRHRRGRSMMGDASVEGALASTTYDRQGSSNGVSSVVEAALLKDSALAEGEEAQVDVDNFDGDQFDFDGLLNAKRESNVRQEEEYDEDTPFQNKRRKSMEKQSRDSVGRRSGPMIKTNKWERKMKLTKIEEGSSETGSMMSSNEPKEMTEEAQIVITGPKKKNKFLMVGNTGQPKSWRELKAEKLAAEEAALAVELAAEEATESVKKVRRKQLLSSSKKGNKKSLEDELMAELLQIEQNEENIHMKSVEEINKSSNGANEEQVVCVVTFKEGTKDMVVEKYEPEPLKIPARIDMQQFNKRNSTRYSADVAQLTAMELLNDYEKDRPNFEVIKEEFDYSSHRGKDQGSFFRGSIMDSRASVSSFFSRRESSYRATVYDKIEVRGKASEAEDSYEQQVLRELLVSLVSGKHLFFVASDFEIASGFSVFAKMLEFDRKCHEAMFGMARLNFQTERYENAEKWLVKAYETYRDFAYRVWLGYTYIYMYKAMKNENIRKLKIAGYALKNLQRVETDPKFGLYANIGLLFLSICTVNQGQSGQVPGLKSAETYATVVKQKFSTGPEQYEGYIAWSVVYSLTPGKEQQGVGVLRELISKIPGRPDAYLALINRLIKQQKYTEALEIAEQAYLKAIDFKSFQEKLLITMLYAKCLFKTNNFLQCFSLLQMQYSEAPHFSVLLYLFGKYAVKSQLPDVVPSAIGALQEVTRRSQSKRKYDALYYIGRAYVNLKDNVQAFFYFKEYQRGSIQTSQKLGLIQQRSKDLYIQRFEDTQVGKSVYEAVEYMKDYENAVEAFALMNQGFPAAPKPSVRSEMVNPLQQIYFAERQGLKEKTWTQANVKELESRSKVITNEQQRLIYRAQVQYKLLNNGQQALKLFQEAIGKFPQDIELQSKYVTFLYYMLKSGGYEQLQGASQRPEFEAKKLLRMLQSGDTQDRIINVHIWAEAHIAAVKLIWKMALVQGRPGKNKQLMLHVVSTLLKLKHLLPPVDEKLAGMRLPIKMDQYLVEDFDLIDYQVPEDDQLFDTNEEEKEEVSSKQIKKGGGGGLLDGADSSEDEIVAPAEKKDDGMLKRTRTLFMDESKSFSTSTFCEQKRENHPMQVMGANNLVRVSHTPEPSLFFYSNSQADFALERKSNKKLMSTFKEGQPLRRTSTPIAAVCRTILVQTSDDLSELKQNVPENVKDVGFSVYSDPKFLKLIGKICLKADIYHDLAIQCLYDYLTIMGFYKEFIGMEKFEVARMKTFVMLGQALTSQKVYKQAESLIKAVKRDIFSLAKAPTATQAQKNLAKSLQNTEKKLQRYLKQ